MLAALLNRAIGRRAVPVFVDNGVMRLNEPQEVTALFRDALGIAVEHSRAYHREWLVKFSGEAERTTLEGWRGQFLAAPEADLQPPAEGEVYIHELEGFSVRLEDGTPVGLVSAAFDLPGGLTLEIQGSKREFLLPYRQEFIRRVDRAGRALVVMVPEGLAD